MNYGIGEAINADAVASAASNLKSGVNPSFQVADFLKIYPQFGPDKENGYYLVPELVIQMYINLANACIKEARWHSSWQIAMGWFIAHFCTLYLQGTANPSSDAGTVLESGKARGLDTSISVGDVSVSTDYSAIGSDLEGWAAWKLTIYGQQLATVGSLMGKGGMCIH